MIARAITVVAGSTGSCRGSRDRSRAARHSLRRHGAHCLQEIGVCDWRGDWCLEIELLLDEISEAFQRTSSRSRTSRELRREDLESRSREGRGLGSLQTQLWSAGRCDGDGSLNNIGSHDDACRV